MALSGDACTTTESPTENHARPGLHGLGPVAISCLVAAWSGMCGIGGGLFAVPILHYGYGLRLKESIPISLALVAASTIAGTLAEVAHTENALDGGIILVLVAGCLVGAPLGFRIAKRINARKLKVVFAVLLVLVGIRILGIAPAVFAAGANGEPTALLGPLDYGLAVIIGFTGGLVAPLLGIGGGLVAVPALMLGVPALGHLGARACSLAMATVTSTRSLVLYWRAGQLDLRQAGSFAVGAALGATLGVNLVHLEAVAEIAQKMLGVTLLVVALRFVFDLRRKHG